MAISKFNYNSFNVTPVASKALAFNSDADGFTTASGSSMILIKTLTASADGTLSFVDGADSVILDDTYPVYKFAFINMHPATGQAHFQVNFRDGETAYDAVKTTTFFESAHAENASASGLTYMTNHDLAQNTGFQDLAKDQGNENDESCSGNLTIYNPSSTVFVKHFMATSNMYNGGDYSVNDFVAGYCNTTTAIDGVQFKFDSGNIDSGTIKLYGIADS